MEDLFKKFVNAGVGYIAQGNKKVQSTIEKLVKDSKLTEQEGEKIVAELLKSGETKRAELEKQFAGLANRLKSSVGLNGTSASPKPKPAAKPASKPAAKPTAKPAAKPAPTKAAPAAKPAAAKPPVKKATPAAAPKADTKA